MMARSITIELPPDEMDVLERDAAATGRTKTAHVRIALRFYAHALEQAKAYLPSVAVVTVPPITLLTEEQQNDE